MTSIRDDVRALFNVDDYYQVLRVASDSDQQELKKAYLSRCLEYHPDKTIEPQLKDEFKRKFQLLSEIYNVLSNADSRQQYDSQRSHFYSQNCPIESTLVSDEIPLSDCNENGQYYTYTCRCSGLFKVERSQLVVNASCVDATVKRVFIVNCDSCSELIKIVQ